jgi:membrane fusion protein (multidrug efflux system)
MSMEKGAILVPQRAVSDVQGKNLVAVVGADKKVDIRQVKVGSRIGSEWIITEGLKAGDTVVAEGTQKARAGMTVNPKPFTADATDKKDAAPTDGKKR